MAGSDNLGALARLATTINSRKGGDPETSYTARLVADPALAGRKFGEEAIEALVAALQDDTAGLTAEAADVIYHLLALLAARGVEFEDVMLELERREGRSGLEEKAARTKA